jgi:hypothetical protein
MPIDDARTADEIRAGGDELSVLNAYTESFTGNSQPGQVNADGDSIHGDYSEPDLSMYEDEDHPAWYADDDSEDWQVDEPADEPTFDQQIEGWAQRWTEQQQQANDPNAQALSIVDQRIAQQLAELQSAQQWALEGQADRQERAEFREMQDTANAQDEGSAMLEQIAQSTAQYHGLPPIDPGQVQDYAEQLYGDMSLQYVNAHSSPEEAYAAMQRDDIPKRCVEEAALQLGRKFISNNALKRI